MLKPQAIRDQEFEVKFRGYDPIEVKSFLELMADDFFELGEENRILQEKLDASIGQDKKKGRAMGVLESLEGVDELDPEAGSGEQREENLEDIRAKLAHAESRIETLTTENMGYLSQVGDLSRQLEAFEGDSLREQKEREELMKQVTQLTQQNAELKGQNSDVAHKDSEMGRITQELEQLRSENTRLKEEEGSLKRTLVSAQGFADTMRANAEKEAAGMVDKAKLEAANITAQLEQNVARLTAEIEGLEDKKGEVRVELRKVLDGYISALDKTSADFTA